MIQVDRSGFTMFADFPRTADQRVYHLGVAPGEVANRIVRYIFIWYINTEYHCNITGDCWVSFEGKYGCVLPWLSSKAFHIVVRTRISDNYRPIQKHPHIDHKYWYGQSQYGFLRSRNQRVGQRRPGNCQVLSRRASIPSLACKFDWREYVKTRIMRRADWRATRDCGDPNRLRRDLSKCRFWLRQPRELRRTCLSNQQICMSRTTHSFFSYWCAQTVFKVSADAALAEEVKKATF